MKKKVIIAATALMLATTSVVSAAAIWGKYKGYDIIRIQVDGKTVTPQGTPALSLDGRTMVPISMLGDAGISYSWDQETKTVAIKKGQTIQDDGINIGHVNYMKDLVDTMDMYNILEDLGKQIEGNSDKLSYGFYGITTLEKRDSLDEAFDYLDETINRYNNVRDYYNKLSPVLDYSGIYTSDVNNILNNYYSAIEYYKSSINGLNLYWQSKSSVDFNTYLNNSVNGLNTATVSKKKSHSRYEEYVDIISKY